MKLNSLASPIDVVTDVVYEILVAWLGNLLWKLLGLENNSLLLILPPVIVGLLLVGSRSKKNEEKVKKQLGNDVLLDLSQNNNLAQSGILSLIPLLFFWCGNESLMTQSTNVLVSFAPFALGVYKTVQLHRMVGRLYNVGHNFLERLSESKYQVKIRERWLYKYLRHHESTCGIDDTALKKFVTYKLHLWQSERKDDVKLWQEKDGWVAEVQPQKA